MKKLMLKAFAISFIGFSLTACEAPRPVQKWTNQPVENVKYLQVGMTQAEVIEIMGEPVTKNDKDRRTAFHWCSTGQLGTNMPYARFVIAAFTDGILTETQSFTNRDEFDKLLEQVRKNGGIDCSALIDNVHWIDPADKVIEVRDRNMNLYH